MKIIILIAALAQIAAAQPRLFGGGNATSLRGKPLNSSVSSPTNGCYIQWDTGLTPPAYKCAAGGGGGALAVQDSSGTDIGTATTLRFGNSTEIGWTIADLGSGVLRATPTVNNGSIINAMVSNSAAIAESKLALNFATHASTNDPSNGEKAALAGTSGTPGSGNKYVTDADTRLVRLGFAFTNNFGASTVSTGATTYFSTNATTSGSETNRQILMPAACTARDLFIRTGSTQGAQPATLTLRKNGSATGLTITIAANATANTFEDVTNTASFAAKDLWAFEVVQTAGATSAQIMQIGFRCN